MTLTLFSSAPESTGVVTHRRAVGVQSRLLLAIALASASTAMAADVAMTEFYYAPLNYYFITPKTDDKTVLDTVPGWARTGKSFITSDTAASGLVPLTRFYFDKVARGQSRGSHFYTALDADRAVLRALNPGNAQAPRLPFDEGTNGYVTLPVVSGRGGSCAGALVPVYRAFRGNARFPDDPNHHFTTDVATHNVLVADGWDDEGVTFCVAAVSAAKTSVALQVLDGPISNAEVCYDRNGDGLCGGAEETTRSNASGVATLQVPTVDIGNYRWLARVGTDATNATTGAITASYLLTAPSARGNVISPLTTLAQTYMEQSGTGLGDAERWFKAQTGISTSPLDDYTKALDVTAATFSRVVVAALQAQTQLLLPLVGQADMLGTAISRIDLDRAAAVAVVGLVPDLAAAARDPAIVNAASTTARETAISNAAAKLINELSPLTLATASSRIALARLPRDTAPIAAAAAAGTNTSAFTFTDSNNWFYRTYPATVADNSVDASGLLHYYDLHRQMSGGTIKEWGSATTQARSGDIHWTGTAWQTCSLGFRSAITPRDAAGNALSNYCEGRSIDRTSRSTVNIDGRLISEIVAAMRKLPGSDAGVAYADWGPANLALLGTSTFPPGSNLYYQTNVNLGNGYRYDVTAAQVFVANAETAAGGDTRTTAALACATTTASTLATTLEEMIARAPGKPCIFAGSSNSDGTSLNPNEAWVGTSLFLMTVANGATLPVGTANYYSANLRIRAAFPGGNSVNYLACYERRSDATSRNCTAIGSGTYKIEQLGDGRALTFQNLPPAALSGGFSQVMIERSGRVNFGFQSLPGTTSNTMRLNLAATNALFSKLGIAPLVP
jgi:trimeric autotransporter adhesin